MTDKLFVKTLSLLSFSATLHKNVIQNTDILENIHLSSYYTIQCLFQLQA